MIMCFNDNFTIKDILENKIIISISKDEVRNKKFKRIDGVIDKFKQCGKGARSQLIIVFEYDDMPEEIYEIEEIREWVAKLVDKYPYIFYFIDQVSQDLQLLTACIADLTMVKESRSLLTEEIIALRLNDKDIPNVHLGVALNSEISIKIFHEIISYGEKVNDTTQNIVDVLENIPGLIYAVKKEMGKEK